MKKLIMVVMLLMFVVSCNSNTSVEAQYMTPVPTTESVMMEIEEVVTYEPNLTQQVGGGVGDEEVGGGAPKQYGGGSLETVDVVELIHTHTYTYTLEHTDGTIEIVEVVED